jgi:hypothetical protein
MSVQADWVLYDDRGCGWWTCFGLDTAGEWAGAVEAGIGVRSKSIAAVPFALFGALVAIWLHGLTNDVYFQIGLVTLIGLAAKNAILIVEFAVLRRHEGANAVEAAIDAARLRFRPIVMT